MGVLIRLAVVFGGMWLLWSLWHARATILYWVLVIGFFLWLWRFARRHLRGPLGALVSAVIGLSLLGGLLTGDIEGGAANRPRAAALGDSYSSGEGAHASGSVYRASSGPCHRSSSAYPRRLQAELRGGPLLFVACSGAETADMASQVRRLQRFVSGGEVSYVTVSAGGNDAGFADALAGCLLGDCSLLGAFDRLPRSALVARVTTLLVAIRETVGPSTPVYLVGYPNLFPSRDTPACTSLTGFSGPEREALRSSAEQLDQALRVAADHARVIYVDTLHAFAGHEICTPQPFAHGLVGVDATQLASALSPFAPDSFHPTPDGHACLAQVFFRQVPDPATWPTESPSVGSGVPCT